MTSRCDAPAAPRVADHCGLAGIGRDTTPLLVSTAPALPASDRQPLAEPTIAVPPYSAIAARLAILPLPNGQNRIQVQGLSDRQYVIQASANLLNWNSVSTNLSDSGTIQWTDPQPANQPQRFYRSIAP